MEFRIKGIWGSLTYSESQNNFSNLLCMELGYKSGESKACKKIDNELCGFEGEKIHFKEFACQ